MVACAEAFIRYPDLMARIDAAMPAEEIGRAGHRPGNEINSVHLWSIANFWLLGRKIMTAVDPVARRSGGGLHGARLLGAGGAGLPG